MRAALYARVSTDRQETENQLWELRAYCQRQGWEIFREYVDEDVSGKADRKPKLEALKVDAHRRRFDVVVFWALDRLTRKGVKDAIDILHYFAACGVDFISHQEPYLKTLGPWRDAVVALIATIANFELERSRERIRSGMETAKDKGVVTHRHPHGCRCGFVGANGKVHDGSDAYPDPVEIARLRSTGLSWGGLSKETNLPKTTLRRMVQKGLSKLQGEGTGPEMGN